MQSGIAASQELISQFNDFVSDDSLFGFLVTITGETLTRVATLPASSSDFKTNLNDLAPQLNDDCRFVILKRYPDAPRLVIATYSPDKAPMRSRMIFASTRLSFPRDLGLEHFREQMRVDKAFELSAEGFDAHDAHKVADAPLTEEERTLGEVKRAEREAGSGTGGRALHPKASVSMETTQDGLDALQKLANKDIDFVVLHITPAEKVELVPDTPNPTSLSKAMAAIGTSEPRYTFYRFRPSSGGDQEYLLFFYTHPAGPRSIKDRMMYPLQKRAVIAVAESQFGLSVSKNYEIEDPSEITEESVLDDLIPKQEIAKPRFARPKRPGR
ncbi:actin depolymerizing protein [Xylariaceae sp. FL1272]|nr:actin depolymerizing protein [Xylariaceae sp. FL1272]